MFDDSLGGQPMSVLSRLLPRIGIDSAVVSIEPMSRGDLKQVLALESGAYPAPWSRSVFESELRQVGDGSRHYVVARRGRDVVGYAGVWFVPDPDGPQAHVTNIVVAPPARRQGVAAKLMGELARASIAHGCVAWTLEVRASNTAALELYRRFGFSPAGVRRRYYENTEDAIVMWCHDIRSPEYAERLRQNALGVGR
jgi:[ribosomal protein S18]-alanine N-acetyltransferase